MVLLPRRMLCGCLVLAAWVPLDAMAAESSNRAKRAADLIASPTHKQARTIVPTHDGRSVELQTYCLDGSGNILACVSASAGNYIKQYSPDGDELLSISLTFQPTAINVGSDGTIFAAGIGQMARISKEGKVEVVVPTPQGGDPKQLLAEAEEEAKKRREAFASRFKAQIESLDKQVEVLSKIDEADRTEAQARQLKLLETRRKIYERQAEQLASAVESSFTPEVVLNQTKRVTALAVTDQDVFVTTSAANGSGYEVWRVGLQFESPEKVLSGLRGCCGQMDIQATADGIFVAENTKFQVGVYDRDGKSLSSFGRRAATTSADGFGSCCNPMNIRCCSNGDVLTAESSIGHIKRFSKDGELLAYIGKARIAGGCKHVAVAVDEVRNRYYMMNVDRDHIAVLVPMAEAPEFTPEELAEKEAREGLGRKLVGTWTRKGVDPATVRSGSSNPFLRLLIGGDDSPPVVRSSRQDADRYVFAEDGAMSVTGGMLGNYGSSQQWIAVSQAGSRLLVTQLMNEIEYYTLMVEFSSDDEVEISLMYGDNALSTAKYVRGNGQSESTKDSQKESPDEAPKARTESSEAPKKAAVRARVIQKTPAVSEAQPEAKDE